MFAEEVYSLGLSYEGPRSKKCNYDGRYVRINMKECENINSRNKCQAMADGETSSDSSTGKLAGFLDVVLLLSATFYLKIILTRQKSSNFITKDNQSTAAIMWSSRIPMLLAIQHDIRHNHPHSEKSFSRKKTDSRTGKLASFMK